MCSVAVKTVLFKSFCMCFYGMELWKFYTVGAINRLRSCYIRCMKSFLDTQEGTVWLVCYLNCIYQPLILCCGTWLINYSHVTIHWYLSCSCYDVILCYFFTACLSGVALSFIFHVLWFITAFVCVCVCVCLCVCFMSMGFMTEIKSCYAMLNTATTITNDTVARKRPQDNVLVGGVA